MSSRPASDAAKVAWSEVCPACKGAPGQGHRYDETCREEPPAANRQEFNAEALQRAKGVLVAQRDMEHNLRRPLTAAESDAVLDALDAATELRMACGRAVLITTSEEVKMPRADWDLIVDAAITQRRTVDPTAVDA